MNTAQALPTIPGNATEGSEPSVVRLERHIQRRRRELPPTFDVPASNTTTNTNPFGGARRLMTREESPEMFRIVGQMSGDYQKLETEKAELDERIQLLIARRVRVDTNLSLIKGSLDAYSKALDIEDILPESLRNAS